MATKNWKTTGSVASLKFHSFRILFNAIVSKLDKIRKNFEKKTIDGKVLTKKPAKVGTILKY